MLLSTSSVTWLQPRTQPVICSIQHQRRFIYGQKSYSALANELVKNLNQVDRLLRLPFRSVFVLHLRHSPHRYQLFSLPGHQKYTTTGVKFPCQRFTGSSAPGKPTRTSLRDVTQAPAICWLPFPCDNSDSAPEINASGREVNPA